MQRFQRGDFRLQFRHRAGGGGGIHHRGFRGFHFRFGRFVQVLEVDFKRRAGRERRRVFGFAQALPQSFAATPQGLVDGFRRGGQAALQDGEREAHGAGALVVAQGVGAVELVAHVVRHGFVEAGFGSGEPVRHRVRDAFGEERCAVELQQRFLHHAAHEVGRVHLVDAIAEAALEAVWVQQREEELEVLLLAVVRRGGHQQEVAGDAGEQLAQPVALGVGDLAAEEVRGHLVRFVAHHQVEAALRGRQQGLQLLVAGQLVQPRDDQIPFGEPVAACSGAHALAGENLELQVEAAAEFVLPLFRQAAGADH